jgi:hypothetical protein
MVSSQNAALVSYRVPRAGQGFTVSVKFLPNPDRKYLKYTLQKVLYNSNIACFLTTFYS